MLKICARLLGKGGVLATLFVFCCSGMSAQELHEDKIQKGVFVEYSDTSQHILMGDSEGRKLFASGAFYNLRLMSGRHVAVSYATEMRPFMLLGDPTLKSFCYQIRTTQTVASDCYAFSPATPITQYMAKNQRIVYPDEKGGVAYVLDVQRQFSRRWTYAFGMSPLGYTIQLRPHRQWRPVVSGLAGLMVAGKDVPIGKSSSFNFTFEFGGGLEHVLAPGKTVRFEYRFHHISNDNIGQYNPGIDQGVFRLSYGFSRRR